MSKLTSKYIDVILQFENLEKKTHKVHINKAPCKIFKKMVLGKKKIKKIINHLDL
jgi:DNA uptake protein ComE-like DNA-binding protein